MKMEETLEGVETTCPVCGRGSVVDRHEWLQQLRIVENPEVLMLVLNRWSSQYGASLHTIKANAYVYFHGRRYRLVSTVCHLGPSPTSGHYIAVTTTDTEGDDWYVYDDDARFCADPSHISTECQNYKGWGQMQSYILMYVKTSETQTF